MHRKPVFYNCGRCPAYCCSYARIIVSEKDLTRLAQHSGIGIEEARQKFTKRGHEEGERVLRHKGDEHFGTVCRFLNRKTRRCTVYKARPNTCREYPGSVRCGYYDFLSFERRAQEDPDFISTTWNSSKLLRVDEQFKQAPNVTVRQVDDQIFLVNPESETVHQLNILGAAVWRLLAEPVTAKSIAAVLQQAFPDVAADQIEEDFDTLIGEFLEEELIESCG